jgi:hypothetical protein
LQLFETAAIDPKSTSRSSGVTLASSASSGYFVGMEIVFIICALFCHQRRLLILIIWASLMLTAQVAREACADDRERGQC